MTMEEMNEEQLNETYKKFNERKDKLFKENVKVQGFSEYKLIEKSICEFYKPDKILENEKSVIFFESSSTGDRKVHIGELIQFLTYVSLGIEKRDMYFVLFLCGEAKSSPKVHEEVKRLNYYYQNFSMKNSERAKIKGLYVANQEDEDIANLTLEKIKKFRRIDEGI